MRVAVSAMLTSSHIISRGASRQKCMRTVLASVLCCLQQPNIEIRELRAADLPRAAGLLGDAFAPPSGYNLLQKSIVRAETESGLRDRIGKSLILVAEQKAGGSAEVTRIVGSVEAFTPDFLRGKSIRFWNASLALDTYVSALAVDPSCRKMGIAQMLMTSVEERAWQAGDRVLSLQVDVTNAAAVALYTKLGYEVVGRDRAVTTPSKSELVSNLFLGGVRQRSLLVLQKLRPEPSAASSGDEDQDLGWAGQAARSLRRLVSRLVRSRSSRTITRQKQPAAVQ